MATAKTYDPKLLRAERRRRSNLRRIKGLAMHALLIALLGIMLYPVIWMVFSAFRPEAEIFGDMGFIPTNWTLDNFIRGWQLYGNLTFTQFYINSFIICAFAIVGNLLACSMAAYAFARLEFRGKWILFGIMLGTMMLPIHVQLIPQYIFFLNIGWVNTILPLIVPKFLAHDAFSSCARYRANWSRRRLSMGRPTGSATGASSYRCRCRRSPPRPSSPSSTPTTTFLASSSISPTPNG
jgi:multiple sugar transport system permease protein